MTNRMGEESLAEENKEILHGPELPCTGSRHGGDRKLIRIDYSSLVAPKRLEMKRPCGPSRARVDCSIDLSLVGLKPQATLLFIPQGLLLVAPHGSVSGTDTPWLLVHHKWLCVETGNDSGQYLCTLAGRTTLRRRHVQKLREGKQLYVCCPREACQWL